MPGQVGAVGQIAQGFAHQPCRSRQPGKFGELAIGDNMATGHRGKRLIDPLLATGLAGINVFCGAVIAQWLYLYLRRSLLKSGATLLDPLRALDPLKAPDPLRALIPLRALYPLKAPYPLMAPYFL